MSVPMTTVQKAYCDNMKDSGAEGLAALLSSKKTQFARAVARSLKLDPRFVKITDITHTGGSNDPQAKVKVQYAIELRAAGRKIKAKIKKKIRKKSNHVLGWLGATDLSAAEHSAGKDEGEGADEGEGEQEKRWPSAEEVMAELMTEEFQQELKSMLAQASEL